MAVVKFSTTPDGVLQFGEKEIANFAPQLDLVFMDATGEATGLPVALQVSFVIKGQVKRQTATIPYKSLDKFNFEEKFPGCSCLNSNGSSTQKLVVRYIREQLGKKVENGKDGNGIHYPTSGWHTQPDGLRFIAGDRVIGPPLNCPHMIDAVASQVALVSDPKLTACESAEMLIKALTHFPDITVPVYSFTLYAQLRSILHKAGLPTACALYLVGHQGFGKTETAKRFCALYQDKDHNLANVYDLHSTDAAMRDAVAEARDRIVVLDDICKTTDISEQRKRKKLAASLIRASTNGTPIVRKRGKEQETVECSASVVITGESMLEAASDLTRCIIVNVNRQLTDGDDSDRIAAASALAGFLQWFAEHADCELARLRAEYNNFKSKERPRREERLQISLWELSWVFGSFLRFAEDVKAISHQAAKQIDEVLTRALHKIFNDTLQRLDKLNLHSLASLAPIIKAGAYAKKFPWFPHSRCLCVRAEDLTNYLETATGQSTLDVKDVTATLQQQHLLCMDNTGKSTRKINGVRMLTIPLEKLGISR